MQRISQILFAGIAVLAIGGLLALPLFVPQEDKLARIAARSQTAQADDAWWGDYQMGFDAAGTYDTSDILSNMYSDQGYGSAGAWDPSSPERSPESQAYIDQHGYGWAPCMDLGNCDSGSLKDSPSDSYYYDSWGYEEPYQTQDYYYDAYYDYYDDYGYAQQTGSYVSAGLAQVPIILTNTIVQQPQSVSYPSYVQQPIQTVYYAQPQTYSYQQPTYSYQSSGVMEPAPVVQAQQYEYIQAQTQQFTVPQVIQAPQITAQQSAQITDVSYISAPRVVSQPTQTTWASFSSATQPASQVVVHIPAPATNDTVSGIAPVPRASCIISAKPARIAAGATTTISWEATNASSAKLAPVGGTVALAGSTTVRVSTTTSFTLSVSGSIGSANCTTKVTIDPTMCLPGCPPGYVCTPVESAAQTSAENTTGKEERGGFWSWLGF